ncbi:type II secretion system protein GspM [Diaphorobacter limosus]|uniref:Type II secretion system protein GspM n=1 Tax=Diaphorobacter limosus TaxID=3036128 RepID=A0ABZ0J2P8_9BURK|nr:type II secretion system protein GspM [Diaphorobacter sp. Y-1]WOO31974.1 type II secretion system protein GspM [Diaphorobacter sp. Y-1]
MNPNAMPPPRAMAAALRQHWASLAPREQTLVLAAATVLGLALLWSLLLAPALAQLRASPARHAALDAQLQQMQALQAQALHLKDIPRPTGNETLPVLWRSLGQQLSAGTQMSTTGDRAAITLKDVPPEALAQWLAQVRSTTRAVPTEARLMRNTASTGGASPPAPWNGTLTLALPPN